MNMKMNYKKMRFAGNHPGTNTNMGDCRAPSYSSPVCKSCVISTQLCRAQDGTEKNIHTKYKGYELTVRLL